VPDEFVWRDAVRTVVMREDGLGWAVELLGEHGVEGFELLSTERILGGDGPGSGAGASALAAAATAVHEVPSGAVANLAADLLDRVGAGPLVGLGGGRVIDTAKALAALGGNEVAAIPTTMSGAEMTAIHRLPAGAEERARGLVRPSLVLADPELMTSAPEDELRASSMNALAHAADSLYTPFANPVAGQVALRGAGLIATALDQDPDVRDRRSLALGSLLSGYAIDSALFGLHHVACQTLVGVCGTPHAGTNAAVLPQAVAFLTPRAPERYAELAAAAGTATEMLPPRLRELGGNPPGLGALGADEAKKDAVVEAMLERHELSFVPGTPVGAGDLRRLLDAAW
jgi:alcohol dehydrogenase class IV